MKREIMSFGLVLVALTGVIGCLVLFGLGRTVPEGFMTIIGGAVGALGGAYMSHHQTAEKTDV